MPCSGHVAWRLTVRRVPRRAMGVSSLLGMIQRSGSGRRLYIILHNIDGPGKP